MRQSSIVVLLGHLSNEEPLPNAFSQNFAQHIKYDLLFKCVVLFCNKNWWINYR